MQTVILAYVLFMVLQEWSRRLPASKHKLEITAYSLLIMLLLAHVLLYAHGLNHGKQILLGVAFASVLSDVTAFFMGNYGGRHKLPAAFNDHKSWEGVAGQIIGAFIGITLAKLFLGLPALDWWVALPVGIGAALGDLLNSFMKRREGVKDWSNFLPGHGGFLDRFASLSFSIALSYWLITAAL
jgi:phosphatidate cytidylyltransferase